MRCQLTKERIIISIGALIGMVAGLIILIPGIILYTESAPHLGFYFNPVLCPHNVNKTRWTLLSTGETDCSAPSIVELAVDDISADIPILTSLLYPDYPYQVSIYLPAKVSARFSLALIVDGGIFAHSSEIDTKSLSTITSEERELPARLRQETTVREEVPIGEAKVKLFDVEGGEEVRIWRPDHFDVLNGEFAEDVASCPSQQNAGCQYIPLRSMTKFTVPMNIFTFEKFSPFPANATFLRLQAVTVTDTQGERGLVPEFWIEIDGNESQDQFIGLILIWIGGLLLDTSPGIAYYFLTRIKSVKRLRQT